MRAFLVLVALAAMLAAPTSASARTQSSVTVHASKYGRILFDGRGFALYTFTRDARGRSTCSGACAKKWPPYIVSRRPVAGVGAKRSVLGTIRRSDGTLQATYAGRPSTTTSATRSRDRSSARTCPCSAASGSSSERTGGPFTDRGSLRPVDSAVDLPPGSTIWQDAAGEARKRARGRAREAKRIVNRRGVESPPVSRFGGTATRCLYGSRRLAPRRYSDRCRVLAETRQELRVPLRTLSDEVQGFAGRGRAV
jgi:predicted lipoprotein with Yx(FWY)xxD motif